MSIKKIISSIINYVSANQVHSSMQSMMDTIPIVMTVFDANFKMLDCNAEILRILGVDDKRIYMENFYNFSPPFQACGTASRDKVNMLIEEGIKKGRIEFEWVHQDINGKLITLDVTGICGEYKGKAAFFVYGQDKQKLKAVSDRFQIVFDSTPILIDYWNEDIKCIDCNQFAVSFYDLKDKAEYLEIVDSYMPDFQPDGSRSLSKWADHIKAVFEMGSGNFEFVAQKKDGELVFYDVLAVRMEMDGQNIVATYSRNITEKINKEAAEANSQAKSQFLARMSHEIRTPITAVLGISEIQLQNTSLAPDVAEAFAKIHNSSKILLEIVNEILDLSAIEAGKVLKFEEEYSPEDMMNDVIQLHLAHMSSQNINFEVKVDPQIPAILIGDVLRIKQILTNVLTNAFKYTRKGSVSLNLSHQHSETDGQIILAATVSDTGIGMTRKQLDSLFDDYVRFNASDNRHVIGSGLGMPIVYSLVKLLGADLNIESQVNKGTTVVIHFPQKTVSSGIIGKEAAQRLERLELKISKGDFVRDVIPHGSVLVVDDVEANLYVIKGLLSFYDLHIETCSNAYEALEKIRFGKTYDIIFMDHIMPGMTGMEAAKNLREMGYSQPIIALTADVFIGRSDEFIRNGFDGFIAKPIHVVQLNATLIKFIKDNQAKEGLDDFMEDPEFIKKMRTYFIKDQKNTFEEISNSIINGDYKTSHRIAHTLKGLAAMAKEEKLAKLAKDVESLLIDGIVPDIENLEALRIELDLVLSKFEKDLNIV